MARRRSDKPLLRRAAASLAACAVAAFLVQASAAAPSPEPTSLAHARVIRSELDARYRGLPGGGLAVTEASSTSAVESFALPSPNLLETRFVSAANGIYYAICPARATCPYPAARFARPAADLASRRLALELALRTFLETSADVVAVSLPTARFIAFIVERDELVREFDLPALAETLRREPARALSSALAAIVDRLTRPHVFIGVGLEPTPSGRDCWVGIPRWPSRVDGAYVLTDLGG